MVLCLCVMTSAVFIFGQKVDVPTTLHDSSLLGGEEGERHNISVRFLANFWQKTAMLWQNYVSKKKNITSDNSSVGYKILDEEQVLEMNSL